MITGNSLNKPTENLRSQIRWLKQRSYKEPNYVRSNIHLHLKFVIETNVMQNKLSNFWISLL